MLGVNDGSDYGRQKNSLRQLLLDHTSMSTVSKTLIPCVCCSSLCRFWNTRILCWRISNRGLTKDVERRSACLEGLIHSHTENNTLCSPFCRFFQVPKHLRVLNVWLWIPIYFFVNVEQSTEYLLRGLLFLSFSELWCRCCVVKKIKPIGRSELGLQPLTNNFDLV